MLTFKEIHFELLIFQSTSMMVVADRAWNILVLHLKSMLLAKAYINCDVIVSYSVVEISKAILRSDHS